MKVFRSCGLKAAMMVAAMLVLNLGYAQAQTAGQIPMFGQPGTGFCNSTGGNDCVDSNITQDPTGNVGIGTTSPGVKLHLAGTDSTGYAATIQLQNQNAGGANAFITASDDFWTAGANKLLFGLGATGPFSDNVKMAIDSSGNVGIGTTTPVAKLDVEGGAGIGVRGSSTNGTGVFGTSTNSFGVVGRTMNDPNVPGVLAISAGGLSTNLGLRVFGRFTATGTKMAVVPLEDGQHVSLYAEESTEVWFSDYGNVQLVNGLATVQIDREFFQTVNTSKDYHVFLTARGNPIGALYIDNETPSSFEIRESTGTANIKVSYRIVAKRKDFADERMKKVESPYVYRQPETKSVVSARDPEGMKGMEERESGLARERGQGPEQSSADNKAEHVRVSQQARR